MINATKSYRTVTWAIVSSVIVAAIFFGGLFKNSTAGSSHQKAAEVISQLT